MTRESEVERLTKLLREATWHMRDYASDYHYTARLSPELREWITSDTRPQREAMRNMGNVTPKVTGLRPFEGVAPCQECHRTQVLWLCRVCGGHICRACYIRHNSGERNG